MRKKILVVGDSMEDVRLDCEVSRLCPEAPLPIYDIDQRIHYAGGAANVALNIAAMGGEVTLLTAKAERTELDTLYASGIGSVVTKVTTANTVKTRVFTAGVMRARMDDDYILDEDESEDMLALFIDQIKHADVVVFSDYGKGALRHVANMLDYCTGKLTLVDPKGDNWARYENATYIKANAAECAALQQSPAELAKWLNNRAIVRTAGAAGYEINYVGDEFGKLYPAHKVAAVDPTGAGDSYLAAMTVGLAAGRTLQAACRLGSIAGALATTHVGTAVITSTEINECLKEHYPSIAPL
jgi:D-beta-D-heptose 7-phosphate kinase/D-beta-D-heptose 1-phosphate adenosyltransferase